MHFTFEGVFWECQTQVANDAFPVGFPRSLPRPAGISQFEDLRHYLSDNLQPSLSYCSRPVDLYKAWTDFVIYYSSCKFTVETDRLKAINGIAQDIARVTNDTFICGLLKSSLIRDLSWHRHGHRPKTSSPWHCPTWTWASTGCPILYRLFWDGEQQQFDVRNYARLINLDVDVRASGHVKRASITLRGKIVTATLSVHTELELKEGEAAILYGAKKQSEFIFASLEDISVSLPYTKVLTLMPILEFHRGQGKNPHISCALILEACDGEESGKFRCVGLSRMNSKKYEHFRPNESNEEHVLTII